MENLERTAAAAASESGEIVVHKFRGLNGYFWKSLEESTLYFASPEHLNDPFDCQIDLNKAFHLSYALQGPQPSAGDKAKWALFAGDIMDRARTIGIFSFSGTDLNSEGARLLWAHYADNHKGVCLTYNIPNSFVIENLIGVSHVTYDESALLNALRALDLTTKPAWESIRPIVTSYLTTKSREWSYEHEGRLIGFKSGPIKVAPEWLKRICFGLRTPESDRDAVEQLVTKSYPHCELVEIRHSMQSLISLEVAPVPKRSKVSY